MDPLHRQILRKNRTSLIENIAKPDDINEKLYERQVFTESMRQDIEAAGTDIKKTRDILDLIPRRGPHAFEHLIGALADTGNYSAVDILRSDPFGTAEACYKGRGGHAVPDPGTELPKEWPNAEAMTEEIRVKECSVLSPLVRYKWLSNDVYAMRKRVRGRCLIISNKVFYGPLLPDEHGKSRCILSQRDGTEQDVDALKKLFTQLQFNVIIHQDKTKQEMRYILETEGKNAEHGVADCFICVICSHGVRHGIYGVDGEILNTEDVTRFFNGRHCPALIEKPKLFFIQACQGEEVDRCDLVDAGPDISDLVEKMTLENRADAQRETSEVMTQVRDIPINRDMLVASATHPGYVSLRHTTYGTWFIQAVVYVFQRFACEKHILDLLTLVNKLVAKGRSGNTGGGEGAADRGQIMQASVFNSSLVQDFYFFPGIIEDS